MIGPKYFCLHEMQNERASQIMYTNFAIEFYQLFTFYQRSKNFTIFHEVEFHYGYFHVPFCLQRMSTIDNSVFIFSANCHNLSEII